MTWEYGKEGQEYPVSKGDIWVCGNHTIHCLDITEVSSPPSCDLIYCDPPWGKNLWRGYHTKAGVEPNGDYADFLQSLFLLFAKTSAPGYVECGKREVRQFTSSLQLAGLTIVNEFAVTYYRTRPSVVIAFQNPLGNPLDVVDVSGFDDEKIPAMVMEPYQGVVFDPCYGRGLTGVSAQSRGLSSVGYELNPARVSAALCRLRDCGAGIPVKEG